MAKFHLTNQMLVSELKKEFNDTFGAKLRIYVGRSQVNDDTILVSAGLKVEGVFECRSSLTCGRFIERMQEEFALKVKVYTCDEWVAVLDGLTLESAGKVKKNAVKADMESMIAYQHTEESNIVPAESTTQLNIKKVAQYENYTINILSNNSVAINKDGIECSNSKGGLREVAALVSFEVDGAWTTQQLGSKLVDFLNNKVPTTVAKPSQQINKEAETEQKKTGITTKKIRLEAKDGKVEADKEKVEKVTHTIKECISKEEEVALKDTLEEADAVIGKSNGALLGAFSVNEKGDKICFSKGALQFNPAKYEFRFADTQYTVIGENNKNIAPNYDGWIDLFGWGTSGYMGCQPTEVSERCDEYAPSIGNGNIAETNYDWGKYNPITNGGNKEGIWRTPTKNEWKYLVTERPNAASLKARCTVSGIKGYMLMPDIFWDSRVHIPIDTTTEDWTANTYDVKQWSHLESLGVVFIPTQGVRRTKSLDPDWRRIWLSTSLLDKAAWAGTILGITICKKYEGLGVRLIKDIK